MFIYLGCRHVQAREVLDGLHLDHHHPGHRPGPDLAVPRAPTWPPSSTAGCTSWAGPSARSTGPSGPAPSRSRTGSATPRSMVIFSAVAMGVTYLLIRIQGSLPLNPQHFGAVGQALSFNTAASFMTNTNWQNYGGETTMSYFSPDRRAHVRAVREPGHRHRRGHRHGPGLLPAQLPDHRELLGRHDPRPALHRDPHRLRRRDHLRRPGCGADAGRHGQHPRRR